MSASTAWLQLVRLPNLFTAQSNVLVGAWAVRADSAATAGLLIASTFLYAAGTTLNDHFDREEDARERPARPIPSGRIAPRAAYRAAIAFFVVAICSAAAAAWIVRSTAPLICALALAATVIAYDAWLRALTAGPLAMAACRMLNIQLGFSLAGWIFMPEAWICSFIVGAYVLGVSLLARDETSGGLRREGWIGIGLLNVATVAAVVHAGLRLAPDAPDAWLGAALGVCLLGILNMLLLRAGNGWTVKGKGAGIGGAISLLIVLDATLAAPLAGAKAAAAILLLLIPHLVARRRLYVT